MNTPNKKPSFSIVIAIRDQADELCKNLPILLEQSYDNYQIIVVDESSTDNSPDILKQLKEKNNKLYTTFIPLYHFQQNLRRLAFSVGVKASKNEWIIFTDINTPAPSERWLEELSEFTCQPWIILLGFINKKSGDIRLKTYQNIDNAKQIINKTERQRIKEKKHIWMSRLLYNSHYDFIVVQASRAHDVLRFFTNKKL